QTPATTTRRYCLGASSPPQTDAQPVAESKPRGLLRAYDQKRRLLYNAVTRAKERCLVLVQVAAHLNQAPFA
ncbi:ATP-binding domain-containing protein, partial [Burkholderia semiarida]|uniref:hypothetical protein n=1 Tax=Burkholderia semiarida TaxID=2843303 RepID=UPI0023DD9DE1